MDNLDNRTSLQTDQSDLQAQVEGLRHLVVSLLVLMVVISGTLNIYMLRQWRSTSKDLAGIRPQAAQLVAEYQKVSGPLMTDFIKRITEYGRTHPDFAPILAKYGLKSTTPTNPPTAALPASTAPKK